MLTGEYSHTIDVKGRFNFPVKFREELGESFFVTKGFDSNGCLFVYSKTEWNILADKILSLPFSKSRNIQRFMFSSAVEVTPDKQGRILIPQNLRDYAGLTKDILVIGVQNRAEIWNSEAWRKVCEDITPENVLEAMEQLDF